MTTARFGYYSKLSARDKAVYRRSDEIAAVALPRATDLRAGVEAMERALASASRAATELSCQRLGDAICDQLQTPRVRFSVLAKRPSRSWGELHGLYDPTAGPGNVVITLWMRTAQRREVVAFRTFLRTFLHEVGHHLDYELLRLSNSFHTQGFYRRESSLFRQLMSQGEPPALPAAAPGSESRAAEPRIAPEPAQRSLFSQDFP